MNPDDFVFGPADTWESVAARLGVSAEELFAANAGLGGCTTMQSVPVTYSVVLPEKTNPEPVTMPVPPTPGTAPIIMPIPNSVGEPVTVPLISVNKAVSELENAIHTLEGNS